MNINTAKLWPHTHINSLFHIVALSIVGSLLLTISAKISIPFYPVPMTMQTLVVMLWAMLCGWRVGVASIGVYLMQGMMGLPVFSGTPEKGIGLIYMMGPTGGYLAGFVVAAGICGFLAERGWGRTIASSVTAMALGTIAIYSGGLLWLGTLIGWDKPVLALGLYPFLIADAVKLALGALIFHAWAARAA